MNWGMIPFQMKGEPEDFEVGSYIYVPGIREALDGAAEDIKAYVIGDTVKAVSYTHLDVYKRQLLRLKRSGRCQKSSVKA